MKRFTALSVAMLLVLGFGLLVACSQNPSAAPAAPTDGDDEGQDDHADLSPPLRPPQMAMAWAK